MAKKKIVSTQKFLPVKEIHDGIVILRDGGYRTVLMVNAVNFNLKSADEQEALLSNYQSFLNGLPAPIQILVQSRTLDLQDYLDTLKTAATNQTNDLLRGQIDDYRAFVEEMIGVANIMSKTFYVVVPYQTSGFLSKSSSAVSGKKFEEVKSALIETTSVISNGLASLGLSNVQLNTQELIELLYSTYNIDTARRQKLFSVSNVDVSAIRNLKDSENKSES
jgi:hypothetical protein